jgi:lipid-binding SYLF domain-containing protein
LALAASPSTAGDPDQIVRQADQVLHEVMAIPAHSIPETLMSDAQGVAIIPSVIKIGFIAGVRRGHGVVLVRDANGQWGLPQFVTLTGGSVGWQAGVQGTDVVLVFMTRKSVEGLLGGKFTIGADAAAAAGPVGRNAAAATDFRLKAEILSYSRSRGLFAGLALDGSAIEIDAAAQQGYYASAPGQPPARVPESAVKLLGDLTSLTPPATGVSANGAAPSGGPGVPTVATSEPTVPRDTVASGPSLEPSARSAPTARLASLRQSLADNAMRLQGMVDDGWKKYLALPSQVFEGSDPPLDALQNSMKQYDNVARNPRYRSLTSRREFQATQAALRDYTQALSGSGGPLGASPLVLPAPPTR